MIGTSEVHVCKARTVGDWEEFNNFARFGFWVFFSVDYVLNVIVHRFMFKNIFLNVLGGRVVVYWVYMYMYFNMQDFIITMKNIIVLCVCVLLSI